MLKKYLPYLFLFLIGFAVTDSLKAQEFEFQVVVNTPKNQIVDPKVFVDMQNQIQNFINSRKWTNDVFEQEERIKGNISLTITEELSATSFQGQLQIQSARPVFGSTLETALLNHVDEFSFSYEQFQPLEFSDNLYNDHLTSMIAFYMYVILGLDYDSYSPLGGEEYYQKAQNIINIIPSAVASANTGWRPKDGNRTRYKILENTLSPRAKEMRYAIYDYHLRGLDLMPKNTDLGRANIMKAMESVAKVGDAIPNSMIVQMFFNAKRDELIGIFKEGTSSEKSKFTKISTKLDPANAIKYRGI